MNLFWNNQFSRVCPALLILGLLFAVSGCSKPAGPLAPFDEQVTVQGLIAFQGKPAAGARVYAYEVSEFLEEERESRVRIEEILRSQSLEDKDLPLEEWPQNEEADYEPVGEDDDYPEFRGPADFKSALTGADGRYSLVVSPGRYCLVARKRANSKVQVGPLTPEDYSSLLSKPLEMEEGGVVRQDFRMEQLIAQTINFAARYTIKARETEIQGVIQDENAQPLAGFYITADRQLKVSHKPDFFSEPGNDKGEYTLYLPGGGVYFLSLRRTPMGKPLSARVVSEYVNPADSSLEIMEAEVISGVRVILVPHILESAGE